MDIVVGVLVIGAFIGGGMLLQHLGGNMADGADHPALRVLGVILMVIGLGLGALIAVGASQAAQQVPYLPWWQYR